jgi:hypothetical protein
MPIRWYTESLWRKQVKSRAADIESKAGYAMMKAERFARHVFLWAGVYGVVVLAPQYLVEAPLGRDLALSVMQPEVFYGFVGVALAWQFAFLAIARDPHRLRPLMPVAAAEKFLFAASSFTLLMLGRAPAAVGVAAGVDAFIGFLFLVAFVRLRSRDA